jgi:hypothetical protein
MSKSKVSYLLSDGLGPHFRREMCASICETKSVFTLQYDETANTQNRKQCDLLLRYWSEAAGEIRVQFLKALMFGHAKGKDVSIAILETLQEEGYQLPLAQLISLGSDGPNVNKTIWNLINEHMKTNGLHGILPFIPCNLHIVHNAFRQGLNIFGEQAEQLVLDLFFFLKASPCRKEDFFETQLGLGLDSGLFIKHVQSRWLTLIPAVKRVLICWDAVEKYFLIELPRIMAKEKKEASLKNNERYKRICQKIERSLSENKKVVTNERTLLSDASINALRSTKDAIRVTASGQAHMMPITPALMQARRNANSVYTARLA